jgi:hypothetical protein
MRPLYDDWNAAAPGWASPAERNRAYRAFRWDAKAARWWPIDRDAALALASELDGAARHVRELTDGQTGLNPNLIRLRSYAGACNRVAAEIRRVLES